MPKICQAYSMTPTAEKSTFTFIPLTRIWNLSSGPSRLANLEFWDDVARDIKLLIQTMTDGSRDATSAKMIQKLRQWVVVQGRWKASVSETTPATSSAVVPATQDLTTLNDNMILRTSLFPVRQSAASPASIAPRPWATRSKLPPVASSEFVMEQNMSSIISSTNKLLMAPSILDSTDEIVTAPNSDWKRTPISFKGRPQAPSVSLGLGHMLSTSSIWGGASPDNTRSW
uniref:Uncharacterized protein n=1 Tax=Spongospora subterranea TaxID=70186 RepID=A0A0H5RD03_9EUKA|eukprot:CRZ11636.1 hypothetical protein [Spongospora subterranea]